jgi:CDP-diacylglycerol--glycerol-3-phosphate 3-phosphatidyltransferase
MEALLKQAPWALVCFRALLAPVVVLLAWNGRQGIPMAATLAAALLSDICDGMLARSFGTVTAPLRRADSIADTLFYVSAACAAWILNPGSVRSVGAVLAVLIGLEVVRYLFDFVKFQREASYHAYSAKAWGLILAIALILLLAYNVAGGILVSALWLGILASIEGLAISIVLPAWSYDVPSIVHALKLRTILLRGVRQFQSGDR